MKRKEKKEKKEKENMEVGRILSSPQYAQRITKDEYERQSREYTQKMLQDLSSAIRRKPDLTKRTQHYQVELKPLKKQEAMIKLQVLVVIFALALCMLLLSPPKEVSSLRISDSLCLSSTKPEYKLWNAVTKPPFVVGFSLTVFVLWIASMNLGNLKYQLQINLYQQIANILIDFMFPFLVTSAIVVLTASMMNYSLKASCFEEANSVCEYLFNMPFLGPFFKGTAGYTLRMLSLLRMDEPMALFIAFISTIYLLRIFFDSVANIKSPKSISLFISVIFLLILQYFG
jgi:hypothetical protein